MIKVAIIEDESAARSKLKRFIEKLDENIQIVAELQSLGELQDFFRNPVEIDVIISDIELRDGNVFLYLEKFSVNCPIIFTTAYNQFWTNAFEGMGIEYLLKPYNFSRFQKAWYKFKKITIQKDLSSNIIKQLKHYLLEHNQELGNTYRERFTYKKGNGTAFVKTDQITMISADQGAVFFFDSKGNRILSSENGLLQIFEQLDSNKFFMINRSEILHKKFIEKIERYSKNVIAIKVVGSKKWFKTSQSRTSEFNEWVKR